MPSRLLSRCAVGLVVCTVGTGGLAAGAPASLAATSAPVVTSVSSVGAGAVNYNLTITGSGFVSNASVSFYTPSGGATAGATVSKDVTGAGVTTAGPDGRTLTVPVTVASSAAAGEKLDVSVANPGSAATDCFTYSVRSPLAVDKGCLTVDAAPSAFMFTGPLGANATNHLLAFTATGLQAGTGSLLFASGSPVTSSASFELDAGATDGSTVVSASGQSAGTAPVTLVNGDGGRASATLTIDAPPTLTGAAPASLIAGQDYSTTLTGTGFSTSAPPTVSIDGMVGDVADGATDSSLSADFGAIPDSYPAGPASVQLVNDDGGSTVSQLVAVIGAPAQLGTITVSGVGDGVATIGWNPEGDTGGADVTGYTVTTTPDTGPHLADPDDSSLDLADLTDGVVYTATVTATNVEGLTSPPATSTSFTPNASNASADPDPVLVLKTSAASVAYGKHVTFSGVASIGGVPDADDAVALQLLGPGGVLRGTGALAFTGDDGSFVFPAQAPAVDGTYVATVGAASSNRVQVSVVQLLRVTPTVTRRLVSFTGVATPGSSARRVTVRLLVVTPSGRRLRTVRTVALGRSVRQPGFPFGASAVKVGATLGAGIHYLAVAVLGTPTNAAVQSKVFRITVR